jgi:hypothetical protein
MILNKRYLIFLALALVVSIAFAVPIQAQSISKTSTLTHFDVTLTFPENTKPGDSILVSVSATARSSVRVRDLSVQVLAYVEGGDLQSVGSASLATDKSVSKGNTLQKEFSLTVPANILRGALVAIVSETTRSTGYAYYSYPGYSYPGYYYYGYGYYPYYDNNYDHDYTGPYWYYPYYSYYYYPESYSNEYVESKALPGPYVLADTPERISLKSDYDKLSSDYQQLSSKYDELSVKYQAATDRNNELDNKLSVANQDLNTTRILTLVFVAATIILAVFAAYLHGRRRTVEAPVTTGQVSASAGSSSSEQPQKVSAAHEKKAVPKKASET